MCVCVCVCVVRLCYREMSFVQITQEIDNIDCHRLCSTLFQYLCSSLLQQRKTYYVLKADTTWSERKNFDKNENKLVTMICEKRRDEVHKQQTHARLTNVFRHRLATKTVNWAS